MMRRLTPQLAILCCVGVLGIAGIAACGSSSSSSSPSAAATTNATVSSGTSSLATAKFALHAGLAFGAFHHWIYGPLKAGALKHPTSNKLALAKAGLASLFVYHELKLAAGNAKNSKLLAPLVAPLTAAGNKVDSLKGSITDGSVSESDLNGVNSQLGQIGSTASASGTPIKESVPSLAQLTSSSQSS